MNTTKQNSHSTTLTHMKATIIYLSPFLQSCQHVPGINANVSPIGSGTGAGTRVNEGGSMCQSREQKNYEKFVMSMKKEPAAIFPTIQTSSTTVTATTTTATATATTTVKSNVEGLRQQDMRNRSSRNKESRERRKHFYTNSVLVSAPPAQTHKKSVVKMDTSSTTTNNPVKKPPAFSLSESIQNDKMNENDDINVKTNFQLVDKLNLRNTHLVVMPICESSLENTAATTMSGISPNAMEIAKNTKINSQTTTLECRCFNENSDIIDEVNVHQCSRVKFHQLPRRTFQLIWQQILLRKRLTNAIVTAKTLYVMILLLLISSASCWSGRQDALSNCTFPARWEGSWFLSGYQQPIHIKGSQFSYRGKCAASEGNKYLIVDEKGCHRCLVIYEKHKNVLQYKESFCKGRETLQNLCDQIPGDALLYSLFRESAEPVKCPLKGPFVFTYNRGHGECKSPVSNIESCTEDSRLLLSFQACPDVQGTESTVEELTCLATWKDGNSRYLVGLVSHHHAISNEERYRCFVYEKISSLMGGPSMMSSKDAEYKLAQSGDATCNGLDSAEVGSRIMSLRKPPLAERCDFPVWFKGPRHWHALMGNAVYNYHSNDGSVHIIKPNGYMETRALCEQINKQTSTEMMAVVHYTTGCQSGFMCMMFYRRDTHVIEIQTGKQASRLEDACAPDHFDFNKMPYITLLASNPDPQICPMEGLYYLRGAIGPPYLTTRHKRNHNNKAHGGHTHRHISQLENGNLHKRHSTLSFRNSEKNEKGSWHANTRGVPVRNRRAAVTTISPTQAFNEFNVHDINEDLPLNIDKDRNRTTINSISTELSIKQRNRRDVPGCVTNVKSQRQLWVGCTEPNVIDVRPLCSDDGDEEYSCHGSWSENSTVYIIARHKGTKHGVCISYRPTEGTSAKFVIGDACYRGTQKPPDHHLVANLSVLGKCGETGSSSTKVCINMYLTTIAIFHCLCALLQTGIFTLNHR
ncbi:uncharacterized protein LOC119677419 isoform X2 [Teleopsis dalmanni]|uniref:uncharacterized protein LOC119677419 isoform X2 n=1 Tax=Teleopsis dalmanni TaxID=139649 RepID=UPI0018CCE922|nr:uncharacterized protein LOC119677419 isoform X2 [Teleopsis dalmanni]